MDGAAESSAVAPASSACVSSGGSVSVSALARLRGSLSQREAAQRVQVGMQTWAAWERGRIAIPVDAFLRILVVFSVPVDDHLTLACAVSGAPAHEPPRWPPPLPLTLLRLQLRVGSEELARTLGVTPQIVVNWLRGRSRVSLVAAARCLHLVGASPADVVPFFTSVYRLYDPLPRVGAGVRPSSLDPGSPHA